jgi:hypothetical protein
MSKYFKTLWPFLAFLLIFLGIFYKIFLGLFPYPGDLLASWFYPYNSGGWIGYSSWITHKEFIAADVVRQLYPWRDLAIGMLKSRQIPLWNPYAFSGYPLLANLQSSVFYPLNILFFIFNSKVAWIVYVLSQPVLALIFMYLFLRSLNLSKYAALFSGLAFGFMGYMAVWFEWGVVGQSALWLPLILYGITEYFKSKSSKFLVLSAVGLTCSLFSGHIQTTVYVGIVMLAYYVFCAFTAEKNFDKGFKVLMSGAWFILLTLGISAIQILPSLELLQLSARNIPQSGSLFYVFQLPYSHLLTIFAPDFFGNPGVGNAWQPNYAEFLAYFGIVALVFAVIGIMYQRKNKLIYFFLCLSGLALLFALPTPFSQALTVLHIPVLDTSSPARALFIFQFSFVVLAGFGIDTYLLRKNFVWKSLFLLLFIYAGLWIFTIAVHLFPQMAQINANLGIIKRNLVFPTVILITAFIFIFMGIKNNKYKVLMFFCIIILTAIEYQYFLYKFSTFSPIDYFFPSHPLTAYLQNTASFDRVYGYDSGRLETNLPTEWKLQSPEGYDSLYIKRYGELIAAGSQKPLTRSDVLLPDSMPLNDSYAKQVLLNILDVKYLNYRDDLAPKAWDPQTWKFPDSHFKLIYQESKWKVYENLNTIPRAGIFYDFTVEKNDSKIISTLFDKNFEYQQKIILEEKPTNFVPLKNTAPTTAKIISYKANEIKIQTDTKAGGLLFLADNFYPGWTAMVDNLPTKIYRADYTFRAVFVKAGKHTVTFSYMPESFAYGALISALSLIVAATILLKKNKKKDQKSVS